MKLTKEKLNEISRNRSFDRFSDLFCGRLLCDTNLSSQELIRETTYTLTHLAMTQLRYCRPEPDITEIPYYFNSSDTLLQLLNHTLTDAQIISKLCSKLQILQLTKQLTIISGTYITCISIIHSLYLFGHIRLINTLLNSIKLSKKEFLLFLS